MNTPPASLPGVVDKSGILVRIRELAHVELELGCGRSKKSPQAIGVDLLDYPCVDIVGDALEVLRAVPDESVDAVRSWHFFEHLDDFPALYAQVERVLKPGGVLQVAVPHFSNPYFYSDYTHRSFFGLYTFSYLAVDQCLRRTVPTYSRSLKMALVDVRLHFGSAAPFHARHVVKKTVGRIVNAFRYLQEFYEENLCYVFPCYEIEYRLRKL